MMTLSKLHICLLLFFALLPLTLRADQETGSAHSIARHLQEIQAQGSSYRIGDEQLFFPTLLPNLYRKQELQLLWDHPHSIDQLFAAIEASGEEGLTPGEYHLMALNHLRQWLALGGADPALRADFDLLLTDAFIRLAYDKAFGKVDPNHLYGDWNLPERNVDKDFGAIVENAIFSNSVGETLDGLSPQLSTYRELKQALAHYGNIRKRGGWPEISEGSTMRRGMEGKRVLSLRVRLHSSGDLAWGNMDSPVFDAELEQAVLRFQGRHYLEADGLAGRQTLAALNLPVEEKIDQIRANMERCRWLSHDMPGTIVLVDIAGFVLRYYRMGELVWSTRVVVGEPYHKTPIFAAAIKYLVINPAWSIPRSILKNEVLPKIQEDSSYLQEENLEVIDHQGRLIDLSSIAWHSYTGRTFPYALRQTPGPHNALGRVKFIFPNKYSVYLHDTPNRELFEKDKRAFSHGCIRVDKPLELAELILQNDGQEWDIARLGEVVAERKMKTVLLADPLPIMLLYWTVNVSSDRIISFKQDVYGRDELLLQGLDGQFHPRQSVVNGQQEMAQEQGGGGDLQGE